MELLKSPSGHESGLYNRQVNPSVLPSVTESAFLPDVSVYTRFSFSSELCLKSHIELLYNRIKNNWHGFLDGIQEHITSTAVIARTHWRRNNSHSGGWTAFCLPGREGSRGLCRVKVWVMFAEGGWVGCGGGLQALLQTRAGDQTSKLLMGVKAGGAVIG